LINVVGAFLLGVLLERLRRARGEPERRRLVRLFSGTGFLGCFTTYSALAVTLSNSGRRVWLLKR